MIRHLEIEDLDWLVDLTVEFNDTHYGIPLDLNKTRKTLEYLILDGTGVGFRSENGAIIGNIEEDPFRDYAVLQERGWFSKDRSGIKLLRAFTNYGLELGVSEVRVSTLESNPGVKRVLKRYNYKPIEVSHGFRVGD